jgi:glycosyltransferase involved in cell wall biosynthesis
LDKYGLKKNGYFLQVCRLEPENNSDLVIREYGSVETNLPLVIVGDAPYSDSYKVRLKEMADPRVYFAGAVYGREYDVLRGNAFCYIHAHEVGGTNPSLLEALAAGNCVAVLDVPYNVEVTDNAGLAFSRERGSLSGLLQDLVDNPGRMEQLRHRAVERIRSHYSWETVIDAYEKLFIGLR